MCVAERAVDGDTTADFSRWLSTPDAPTHWLVVDLEQVRGERWSTSTELGKTPSSLRFDATGQGHAQEGHAQEGHAQEGHAQERCSI